MAKKKAKWKQLTLTLKGTSPLIPIERVVYLPEGKPYHCSMSLVSTSGIWRKLSLKGQKPEWVLVRHLWSSASVRATCFRFPDGSTQAVRTTLWR